VIRAATVEDAAVIASIHARTWRHAYADIVAPDDMPDPAMTRPAWRERILGNDVETIVFEQDGRVAGFAAYGPSRDAAADERTGELYAIYVDPTAQGAGVGTALLTAAVERLAARGFADAMLWTLQGNGLAQAFYARHGWTLDEGAVQHDPPEVRYRRALSPSTVEPGSEPPGGEAPWA
jgi:ribosomal protein S18 acetylase RimI-like enzyme